MSETPSVPSPRMPLLRRDWRWGVASLLALLVVFAFFLRALGAELVFPGGGDVVYLGWDAYYHARRALFSFVHFPSVLRFDPYLVYPTGAAVPWPPLYDLLLAGVARLFGDDLHTFEVVVAWVPAALGALTVLPVYGAARTVGGSRRLALGAGLLLALLPAAIYDSSVGYADHDAITMLLGAILLWAYLEAVHPARRPAALNAVFALLVLVRLALLESWEGSPIYLIGEPFLLGVAVLRGGHMLRACAASAAVTGIGVLLLGALGAVPGPATVESSYHHTLGIGYLALGALAGGYGLWLRMRPTAALRARLVRFGVMLVGVGAVVLGVFWSQGYLRMALSIITRSDPYAAANLEQSPMFGARGGPALMMLGFFFYLTGLASVAALARARRREVREPALLLAIWSAVFALLAVRQIRFAGDYAPSAAIVFALLVAEAAGAAARRLGRRWVAPAVAVGLSALLLWPTFSNVQVPRLRASWGFLVSGSLHVPDRALLSHEGTLMRFAREVREATPETAGYLDAATRPAYGILVYSGVGHALRYEARRAVTADNFGPYAEPRSYWATEDFFAARSEDAAIAIASELQARYVVTADLGGDPDATILQRLHRGDGLERGGLARLEHFRLVTEGPPGGQVLGTFFSNRFLPEVNVPYKLFEVVEGATLELHGPPGSPVSAMVRLRTPLGRRVLYEARGTVGDDGVARLRVPYATRTRTPVRPRGPYRVEIGDWEGRADVSDAQVEQGAVVAVGPDVSPAAPLAVGR